MEIDKYEVPNVLGRSEVSQRHAHDDRDVMSIDCGTKLLRRGSIYALAATIGARHRIREL